MAAGNGAKRVGCYGLVMRALGCGIVEEFSINTVYNVYVPNTLCISLLRILRDLYKNGGAQGISVLCVFSIRVS